MAPSPRVQHIGERLVDRCVISAEQRARRRRSGRRRDAELVITGIVAPRHVKHALWRRRGLALTAFATVVGFTVEADEVVAGSGRAELGVSVVVPPVAVMRVERQASQLVLTEADVARGYVDVPMASRLAVRTTSPAGYVLDFFTRLPLFTSVSVTSPAGRIAFGSDGGTLVARAGPVRGVTTILNYRFRLGRNTKAGAYPWPLAISIRPL